MMPRCEKHVCLSALLKTTHRVPSSRTAIEGVGGQPWPGCPGPPSLTLPAHEPSCFLKCAIHISSDFWDTHFCSNIYPVSTLKVKKGKTNENETPKKKKD